MQATNRAYLDVVLGDEANRRDLLLGDVPILAPTGNLRVPGTACGA